jgi:hypothetical protein
MTMMTFPGGVERTETEFRELFRASGFELTSVAATASMVSVVEGQPSNSTPIVKSLPDSCMLNERAAKLECEQAENGKLLV